jgi:hypothetical protein
MLRPEAHLIKTLLHNHNLTCWLQTDVKDTNGAGDTFATTYMLAIAVNDRQPGVTANWAASRAVAQPQVLFNGPSLHHSRSSHAHYGQQWHQFDGMGGQA